MFEVGRKSFTRSRATGERIGEVNKPVFQYIDCRWQNAFVTRSNHAGNGWIFPFDTCRQHLDYSAINLLQILSGSGWADCGEPTKPS
jgi:hypothetical protein